MKKIFTIFAVFVGLIPVNVFAGIGRTQCIENIKNSWKSAADYFCVKDGKNKIAFVADNDYCRNKTIVCALGTTIERKDLAINLYIHETEYTSGQCIVGKRTCVTSRAVRGKYDTWHNIKLFEDCPDKKWKKDDTNKINEVMVINGKAAISTNKYPMQYTVIYDDNNPTETYPNICVGYYCAGADGKYTEPCDDGTCSDNCQKSSGNGSGDVTPGSGNGGNAGGNDGGTPRVTQPDDNSIHRHTVQKWLNALDAYRATCKK